MSIPQQMTRNYLVTHMVLSQTHPPVIALIPTVLVLVQAPPVIALIPTVSAGAGPGSPSHSTNTHSAGAGPGPAADPDPAPAPSPSADPDPAPSLTASPDSPRDTTKTTTKTVNIQPSKTVNIQPSLHKTVAHSTDVGEESPPSSSTGESRWNPGRGGPGLDTEDYSAVPEPAEIDNTPPKNSQPKVNLCKYYAWGICKHGITGEKMGHATLTIPKNVATSCLKECVVLLSVLSFTQKCATPRSSRSSVTTSSAV
nr:putative uncharacterized protein DDB_G0290521 [Cherax quadricarinatus]XP_053626355.1 putative uncharacterized protein DDB_G0290521 [Cherax quadricarinatus]